MYEPHPSFEEPENKNAKIWRYIDLVKFVSIMDRGALFFVRVSKLEDPYEGTMPEYNDMVRRSVYEPEKSKFKDEKLFEKFLEITPKMLISSYQKQKETLLVNSWHLDEYDSASMWQSYSIGRYGLAIQSSFSKLRDCFKNNSNERIWIGKVKYLDFKKDWMDERNIFNPFMIKRKSFSSDSELRAITVLPDYPIQCSTTKDEGIQFRNQTTKSGKYVPANLDSLIEEIHVSPKAEEWVIETVRSIAKKYGLNKKITQSDLYSLK